MILEANCWSQSDDFKLHPYDPPLTSAGQKQARKVGESLLKRATDDNSFHIVVTSPYLRCVQTAIEICQEFGAHVPLLVDYEMGEIYGPCIMGEKQPEAILTRRSWEFLSEYCAQRNVKMRNKPVGKWPEWPETLYSGRVRFAKRYLRYLHRSLKTRRNFVLVTHADAVATALTVMPSTKDKYISKVEFCGFFVGNREIDPQSASPLTPNSKADALGALESSADGKELENVGIGKGWSLKREGIKVAKTQGPQNRSSIKLLGDTDGYTWDQIENLLGELPSEVISNDQLEAVYHRDVSKKDKEERSLKRLNFSRASFSTWLFGRGESTTSEEVFSGSRKNRRQKFKSN